MRTTVVELAGNFLERVCPPGADPGLAVAVPGRLTAQSTRLLIDFGHRAQREVLPTEQAHQVAVATGVHLSGHGGTRDGILGALAAVGLHLSGNDGLFITLPGIRDLPHTATAADLRKIAPIDDARDDPRRRPEPGETIKLGDWVHPVLLHGRAVSLLEPPRHQPDGTRIWRTAPRSVVKQY